MKTKQEMNLFALRKKDLLNTLTDIYGKLDTSVIMLFAGFESERIRFRQESSFYYLTGIEEPGIALSIPFDGASCLWVPNCMPNRAQWVDIPVAFEQKNAHLFGVEELKFMGTSCTGYQFHPFFPVTEYEHLLAYIKKIIEKNGKIFTLCPQDSKSYLEQRLLLEHIKKFIPGIENALVDISPIVNASRRSKDMHEIELLYKAVEVTSMAHTAAAQAIRDGITEAEVQATIEYIFTGSFARCAFPSIVAGGRNATVLHYMSNHDQLKNGDLALVDIGAEFNYYCGDLTRTYPVSGTFTKRQKELYEIVLETQEYIAQLAKPGIWLSNAHKPKESLNHLAREFLAKKGYEKYFLHGIGHFLGLDVHDVGDYSQPLQEGDVFTIEPGVYIAQEGIGIRIEDNYWMAKDGVVCLSEELPKSVSQIEEMVQQSLDRDTGSSEIQTDESIN